MKLASCPSVPSPPRAAALLLLPLSVLAGGALFWPAACLVAIAAALDREHFAMLVWYGLALGFDPHALVLAPFVAAVLIGQRVPLRLLPLAPVSAAAMLFARGVRLPTTLTLPQDMSVSGGAPNAWTIVQALPWIGTLPLTGLALAIALGVAAAYVAWVSARSLGRLALLDAALLCALAMPLLLPALGPGAMALGVALSLILALLDPGPARWNRMLLLLAGALLAALGDAALLPLAALATLIATVLQAQAVLRPAANDNPLMARTA